MVKKDNSLTLEGASASVNGVANFITALKRSGYFSNIEIKESKQDEKATAVQTFNFQISAQITPPGAPAATTAKPASAPVAAPSGAMPPKVG
jgi:Tfp pilus assembly protein PilN